MNWIGDQRLACVVIALVSAAVLGTALASQYFGGLVPCQLCIYQRWPYVATIAAGIAGVFIVRHPVGRRAIAGLCGFAFLVGGAIAFYHVGVEQHWFAGPGTCSGSFAGATTVEELRRQLLATPVVRCDEVQWSLFGVSMAGYNVLASAALAAFSVAAAMRAGAGRSA